MMQSDFLKSAGRSRFITFYIFYILYIFYIFYIFDVDYKASEY